MEKKDISQRKKKTKTQNTANLLVLILSLVSILCVVFSALIFYFFQLKHALLFSILSGIVFIGLFVFCVFLNNRKKERAFKLLFSAHIFILFCFVVCFVLQKTGFFKVVQNSSSLQAYIERAGVWMPVFYVLLQFLQVVILPIPSIVSTLAGVALFGAFKATLYSLIGILLGSFVAFLIGRKLGYKAVLWMIGEDSIDKWQKKLKGKDNLFLTLMFLMPVFPDDVLCFVAGLSSMSTLYFIIMIFLTRSIGIVATCYSINFIPFNTWWGITIWSTIFIVVIISFIVLYKNMNKIQNRFSKKK